MNEKVSEIEKIKHVYIFCHIPKALHFVQNEFIQFLMSAEIEMKAE